MAREDQFYRAVVPDLVNQRLLRIATLAVGAGQIEAGRYPGFERDAVPNLRRLNILAGLMDSTWRRGITACSVEHAGGTHVEIRGDGFVITTVTRSRMPGKVNPHEYRKTLARKAQLSLFESNADPNSGFIYALMIFGGHFTNKLPKFCRIAFPTPEGDLAPGTIDLANLYPDVLSQFRDDEYRDREVAQFIERRSANVG